MTGYKMSQTVLNNTLVFISELLNKNNIKDWFICYGTLLGIVRENNCIDNDDDIDIIISKEHYDKVLNLLLQNNFEIEHFNNFNIIKTKIKYKDNNIQYSSIDIYMAKMYGSIVKDLWNEIKITNCYLDNKQKTFIEKKWNNTTLYLPNNYLKILKNRYGSKWKIKLDKKIPLRKKII